MTDIPAPHSVAGLRRAAVCVYAALEAEAGADDLADRLNWAADEIDRLNAIIAAESHKTFLLDSDGAKDYRVRNRVWGILAWHVNRTHADLSDHDLAQAAFREFGKHWGRALVDPAE